jgi:hypothetical protein
MKRAAIDWEKVRNRLRASELALEEALAEGPDRIEAAYRQRAVVWRRGKLGMSPSPPACPC